MAPNDHYELARRDSVRTPSEASEVADTIAFLASSRAASITGVGVVIDDDPDVVTFRHEEQFSMNSKNPTHGDRCQ